MENKPSTEERNQGSGQRLMDAIQLMDAAKLLPGKGMGPLGITTMRKWADPRRGYRPRGWLGKSAVLRTILLSRDRVTFKDWVEQFLQEMLELSELAARAEEAVRLSGRVRPLRARKASQRRAEAYLDSVGATG